MLERLAGEQVRELETKMSEEVKRLEGRLTIRASQLELLANETKDDLQQELNKVKPSVKAVC
jgi:hypothetical protein